MTKAVARLNVKNIILKGEKHLWWVLFFVYQMGFLDLEGVIQCLPNVLKKFLLAVVLNPTRGNLPELQAGFPGPVLQLLKITAGQVLLLLSFSIAGFFIFHRLLHGFLQLQE